jgi:integrase
MDDTGPAQRQARGRRRRDPGDGSIFVRADGRWVARLKLGDGTSRYFYGRTKSEVKSRLRDAQRAVEDGSPLPSQRLTVAAYLEQWLTALPATAVKPATVAYYESYVRKHLLTADFAAKPLSRLGPADLERLYARKLADGLSTTTVHHLHAVIHRALARAVQQSEVARNVADLVDPPAAASLQMAVLTGQQPARLLAALDGERLEALYVVALSAGLRRGELLALRWKDVDLDRGVLSVTGSLQGTRRATLAIGTPKSGRSRAVALGPQAVAALRAHRACQVDERLRAGSLWTDLGLVFTNEFGGYLSPTTLSNALDRILRQAGLPDIRFHDLRHSAATLMLSHGVHPKVVSEMLGHASVGITLDLYSHVTPTLQREAADKIGRALAE